MTIKTLETPRFIVSLVDDENAEYRMIVTDKVTDVVKTSEAIGDYNIASYLFDAKIEDLEGQ